MKLWMVLIVVIVYSIVTSLFLALGYGTICIDDESAHENLLGACPEGSRLHLSVSDIGWAIIIAQFFCYII